MKGSLRALLESAVDYAGTFPPARLELADALRRYAEYRSGPHSWMLGSLVLPASKLEEFEELAEGTAGPAGGSWPLSVIISAEPARDLELVESFAHRFQGKARVAALEAAPLEAAGIRRVAARLPKGAEHFFEVPLGPELDRRLSAIGDAGGAAKVRTGGVKKEGFPDPADLSRFLHGSARAGLAFKATAGLHHPFRGPRPLEDDPQTLATMHGFVNLAVAAALIHAGKVGPEESLQVLEAPAGDFRFLEDGLFFREHGLDLQEISAARRRFFRSFGACSFEEPVQGLLESRL